MPIPSDPKFIFPGLAFAYSINSRAFFAGKSGFTANASAEFVNTVIELNAAVSYLKLGYALATIGKEAVEIKRV